MNGFLQKDSGYMIDVLEIDCFVINMNGPYDFF